MYVIVLLDTENIGYGLGKYSRLYLNRWRWNNNFSDFMAAILNFAFKKIPQG